MWLSNQENSPMQVSNNPITQNREQSSKHAMCRLPTSWKNATIRNPRSTRVNYDNLQKHYIFCILSQNEWFNSKRFHLIPRRAGHTESYIFAFYRKHTQTCAHLQIEHKQVQTSIKNNKHNFRGGTYLHKPRAYSG